LGKKVVLITKPSKGEKKTGNKHADRKSRFHKARMRMWENRVPGTQITQNRLKGKKSKAYLQN